MTPWTAAHQASLFHHLSEFAQTHVHWVTDAIQPSHPLSSPSPPAFNLSQHQSLFQWVGSSHEVAKVLDLQLQHQSFQWIFRVDFLKDFPKGLTGLISLMSKGLSRVFSSTFWRHQFFGTQLTHDYRKNHSFDSISIQKKKKNFTFLTLKLCLSCHGFNLVTYSWFSSWVVHHWNLVFSLRSMLAKHKPKAKSDPLLFL